MKNTARMLTPIPGDWHWEAPENGKTGGPTGPSTDETPSTQKVPCTVADVALTPADAD